MNTDSAGLTSRSGKKSTMKLSEKCPDELRRDTQPVSATARMAQPGFYHSLLDQMVGDWMVTMTIWSQNGEQLSSSTDIKASKTWINGDIHLREEVHGLISGKQHDKLTILGYNNLRQRYEFVTADNSDTVIMSYYGQANEAEHTITLFGEFVFSGDGPAPTGELIVIRSVFQVESINQHRLTIYYQHPAQNEYRFLEYLYTLA